MKTPVDTGRARGNWHISIGHPEPSVSETKTQTPLPSEGEKLKSSKAGDTIYIQNNLPYIVGLEYGRSRQAPQGMVRLTMQEVAQYVKDAIGGLK